MFFYCKLYVQLPSFRHGTHVINESVAACMYLEVYNIATTHRHALYFYILL